jgi:hypothetical protein
MCFTFFKMIKDKAEFEKVLRKSMIETYLYEEGEGSIVDVELLKLISA